MDKHFEITLSWAVGDRDGTGAPATTPTVHAQTFGSVAHTNLLDTRGIHVLAVEVMDEETDVVVRISAHVLTLHEAIAITEVAMRPVWAEVGLAMHPTLVKIRAEKHDA